MKSKFVFGTHAPGRRQATAAEGDYKSHKRGFGDGFKLGVKGRGKSKRAKLELAYAMLSSISKPTDDEVIIVDPEDYLGENE